jgi:Zn-dependent protease
VPQRQDGGGVIDLTLQQLVLRFIAYVVIVAVHGIAVSGVAAAMGDQGPRYDGRLTVNPLAHLDVVGTAAGVLFSIGWMRPIAIDQAELRTGRGGLIVVVGAGAAAVLLGAIALRLVRPMLLPLLPDTASATAFALIEIIGQLSVWFAIFNVLPLPPLTGAHLLAAAVPGWSKGIGRAAPYAGLVLAVVAATGVPVKAFGPAYRVLGGFVLGE